eukprot:Sspe_Gene.48559::Locus_25398_Transcript_1_5_Confidence_0.600_Length_513::g.48559::m.48559
MMSNEESESPRAGEESAVAPLPTPPPLSGIAQGSEITDIKDVTHTGRKNECPTCGATFSNEQVSSPAGEAWLGSNSLQEYAMHIVSQHAEIALEALNSHSVDSVEKEDNTSDVSTDSPDIPTIPEDQAADSTYQRGGISISDIQSG